MPIRESERHRYPKDWKAISRRIREREGQRCAWCKAPNGVAILRHRAFSMWAIPDEAVSPDDLTWFHGDGPIQYHDRARVTPRDLRGPVKVVLTVAHLDHTPENCADDNLVALCQRCHNRYDGPMRREGRKARLAALTGEG